MVVRFNLAEADEYIWESFALRSGLSDENKLARLEKLASRYRQTAAAGAALAASVREVRGEFDGGRFRAGGADDLSFALNLAAEDEAHIRRIYCYALTAGDFRTDVDPLTDAFVDLWGNAYCDAAHRLLREKLAAASGLLVSPPFGPGFFGMAMDALPQVLKLARAEEAGIRLAGSTLLPLKSCAGFFFASDRPLLLPQRDCASCIGSRRGCGYCRPAV